MSFRVFVYYCAVIGAWSGLVGWALGRGTGLLAGDMSGYLGYILRNCLFGLFLGFAVAFGLSFLDAAFNVTLRQTGKIVVRVFVAVLIGVVGGLFGSFVGGSLFYFVQDIHSEIIRAVLVGLAFILGWTLVGFLVGASIAFFEVVAGVLNGRDLSGAIKKVLKCLAGGTVGGFLGGCIALVLRLIAEKLINKPPESLWTPTAAGFIAIGACIGLLVGLAQIILMEAWIKVEAGFRPGRQMILSKATTSIGRGEGSDIALFGDAAVEKAHANIVRENGRYFVVDLQTPGGTYVNDQKVSGRTALKTGDLIRVGQSLLRFGERAKRKD
jgi:hypothetical protein